MNNGDTNHINSHHENNQQRNDITSHGNGLFRHTPCIIEIEELTTKTKLQALIDTGSALNLIHCTALERLQRNRKLLLRELLPIDISYNHRLIYGVNNTSFKPKGCVQLEMLIGPQYIKTSYLIVEQLPTAVILGVPAIETAGLVPDVTNRQLRSIHNEELCVPMQVSCIVTRQSRHNQQLQSPIRFGIVCCKTILQPKAEQFVRIQIPGKWYEARTCVIIAQANPIATRKYPGCLISSCILDASNPYILILNNHPHQVTLKAHEQIVTLDLIPQQNVNYVDKLDDTSQRDIEKRTILNATQINAEGLPVELDLTEAQQLVTTTQLQKLKALVKEYIDIFERPPALGQAIHSYSRHPIQLSIDTGCNEPVSTAPYRAAPKERQIIQQHIHQMLDEGIIRPSESPWASPVVLVPKKTGEWRFCIDFRKLNAVTVKDVYPLPRIDTMLDALQDTKYFTVMDLMSGYWQIAMHQDSISKTAFTSHEGLYEFLVMPFGLTNAPAKFQRMMDAVLAGLKWKQCLVYLDDVLVISNTFEEHLCNLRQVWQRLRDAKLVVAPKKCHLCRPQVQFLGYVVSREGITTDPKKITAVKHFPIPVNRTAVKSFLGLASYYRRFICHFAARTYALTRLTCDNIAFHWDKEASEAFEDIKKALITAPVLRHPDFNQPFIIDVDACIVGLGAILMQKDKDGREYVIAYASRKVTTDESKWAVRELEALAIIWGCEQYRAYLFGSQFTVRSDHHSLQWLMRAQKGRLARWALRLQEFNMDIQFRPGKGNPHADALSRNPLLINRIQEQQPPTVTKEQQQQRGPKMINFTTTVTAMYEWRVLYNQILKQQQDTYLQERGRSYVGRGDTSLTSTIALIHPSASSQSSTRQYYEPDEWRARQDFNTQWNEEDARSTTSEFQPQKQVSNIQECIQQEDRWWKTWSEQFKSKIAELRSKVEHALASKVIFKEMQTNDVVIKELIMKVKESTDVNTEVDSRNGDNRGNPNRVRRTDRRSGQGLTNCNLTSKRIKQPETFRHVAETGMSNVSRRYPHTALLMTSTKLMNKSQDPPRNSVNRVMKVSNNLSPGRSHIDPIIQNDSRLGRVCIHSSNNNEVENDLGFRRDTWRTESMLDSIESYSHLDPEEIEDVDYVERSDQQDQHDDYELVRLGRLPPKVIKRILSNLKLIDGILYYQIHTRSKVSSIRYLPVMPTELQVPCVMLVHASNVGCHMGIGRTLAQLRKRFYWMGMHQTVTFTVAHCEACQRRKPLRKSYGTEAGTLSKDVPWYTVGMDFFGPIPRTTKGYKYILVVIDHFTKWPEAYPVKDTTARTVAKCLMMLVTRFGCPVNIVTDNGAAFTSIMISELCKRLNIKHIWTTPYRPQANGIAEAFMKVLGSQLAMLVNEQHNNWVDYIQQLLFAYRSLPHPSTGDTPFFLMYGYDPNWPFDVASKRNGGVTDIREGGTSSDESEKHSLRLEEMQVRRLAAWHSLRELTERLGNRHIRSVIPMRYEIGKLILVKLNPNDKLQLPSLKFSDKWGGPYRVIQAHNNGITYKVRSLIDQNERVVHIENTKPYLYLTDEQLVIATKDLDVLAKAHGTLPL